MKLLILASQSAGRRKLLKGSGYEFEVMVSHFAEDSIKEDDPFVLVHRLALAKAKMVAGQIKKPSVIVAGDQVVRIGKKIVGKPKDESELRQWLARLTDSRAECIDGYAVIDTESGQRFSGTDVATVHFGQIPENEIKEWLRTGQPFKKAGGFSTLEEPCKRWVKKIQGQQSTITGLPMHIVKPIIDRLLK